MNDRHPRKKMSHQLKKTVSRKIHLKQVIHILENDLKTHASLDSFSRCITKDESIEITLKKSDGLIVQTIIDNQVAIDAPYNGYVGLRNLILCDRAMHHLFTSRGVTI